MFSFILNNICFYYMQVIFFVTIYCFIGYLERIYKNQPYYNDIWLVYFYYMQVIFFVTIYCFIGYLERIYKNQ